MGSEHPQEGRSSDDASPRSESSGGDSGADGTPERTNRAPDATEPGGDEMSVSDSPVSVNELFELLAQPGNRYTLAYLVRAEGAVPYDDLVEYVVDTGGVPEGVSAADFRDQVATRLIHSNLPKLDDAGLVEYDPSERIVRATEATAVAVPYLELAMEQFSAE